MRKRNTNIHKTRLGDNSRRRQLLKRVHQKVISRRQNFQIIESAEDIAPAC